MGGFFALATALSYPERVKKLILVGMPVGFSKSLPLPLRIICGIPGMSRLFMNKRPTMEAQRKQYEQMFKVNTDGIPDLYFETRIAGLNLPVEKDTWAVLLPKIGGLWGLRPEVNLENELSSLQPPTLIIWGENDMLPISVGKAASERIPSARFVGMPGIGHFPFLENPQKCAELILDFMEEKGGQEISPSG